MDTEAELQFRPRTGKAASAPLLPEVETYLQLLLVIFLMNSKRYPEVKPQDCPAHCTGQISLTTETHVLSVHDHNTVGSDWNKLANLGALPITSLFP